MNVNAFEIFNHNWALLTAGREEHFNTMTISWGGLGTLWGKPIVTVYVKPIRYTYQFMEDSDYFTVSFYTEEYRDALALLGSRSGRDGNKISIARLTPEPVTNGVTFKEATVTLLCRKIYRQNMDPAVMPPEVVESYYTAEAPHTMFIGEVTSIIRETQKE